MTKLDMALLIDAVARRGDPLRRFVNSLSPELRAFAEETIRMRDELTHHCQSILASSDPRAAIAHAEWMTRHAHEVAYRWASLLHSAIEWSRYDVEGLSCRIVAPRLSGEAKGR